MKKKSSKKKIITLLIVAAIVIIAISILTYQNFKPLEDFKPLENSEVLFLDIDSDITIDHVFEIKDDAIQNIEDFLEVDFAPGTIWEDFYSNAQFNRLKELDIDIDIDNYTNNPNPFVSPTSTDDELEGEK